MMTTMMNACSAVAAACSWSHVERADDVSCVRARPSSLQGSPGGSFWGDRFLGGGELLGDESWLTLRCC